jgi:hypothetical protein
MNRGRKRSACSDSSAQELILEGGVRAVHAGRSSDRLKNREGAGSVSGNFCQLLTG